MNNLRKVWIQLEPVTGEVCGFSAGPFQTEGFPNPAQPFIPESALWVIREEFGEKDIVIDRQQAKLSRITDLVKAMHERLTALDADIGKEYREIVEEVCAAGFDEDDSHVDEFINNYRNDAYARFMFNYFRAPAEQMMAFAPFMQDMKLFCTYEGQRYRVTGASRFGDVWLVQNHRRDHGYDIRADIRTCSEWGAYAARPITSPKRR